MKIRRREENPKEELPAPLTGERTRPRGVVPSRRALTKAVGRKELVQAVFRKDSNQHGGTRIGSFRLAQAQKEKQGSLRMGPTRRVGYVPARIIRRSNAFTVLRQTGKEEEQLAHSPLPQLRNNGHNNNNNNGSRCILSKEGQEDGEKARQQLMPPVRALRTVATWSDISARLGPEINGNLRGPLRGSGTTE